MRTYIFIPPLRKVAGGVAVMLRMASLLHQAGFDVALVPRESKAPGILPLPDVPMVDFAQADPQPQDLWLVPEGWVNALTPGLRNGARCVVYVQNWAYLLSALPADVAWNQLPVSFISVSHPVAWFVEQTAGRRSPVLRPGIDLDLFHPSDKASWNGKLRIAYMPRKNKALLERTREIFTARLQMRGFSDAVEWLAIENLDQQGVAGLLRQAHVFLATGFPEGCPLPPLEAMASGCLVVGYAGFGGWDYLRQAFLPGPGVPPGAGHAPWWPQQEDAIFSDTLQNTGNAFVVPDADVLAAAFALEYALDMFRTNSPLLARILDNARAAVQHYGLDSQRQQLLELWEQAAANELFV